MSFSISSVNAIQFQVISFWDKERGENERKDVEKAIARREEG
jgi:hypothetical protein